MADGASFLTLLGNQTFRKLWIATLASNFGGLVQAVGAAWLMTSLTSSERLIALVQGSISLPLMVFSLFAGVVADNYDRRRVMLIAQCFMLGVSVALTVFAYFDLLVPWLLLSFTFLIGCGTALNNPSWQASMGDIVPRDDLPNAVSLNSMGFNIMRSVGPAAGGAIVAASGAAAAFAVNVLSYVGIIGALFSWRPPKRDDTLPREPFSIAFSAGLRYVAMSPNIIRVMLRALIFGLSAVATLALLPVIVRQGLGGSANTYGVMLGFFGAGAVIAAILNGPLRARFENERIARVAFLAYAGGTAILAVSSSSVLSALALLVSGCCWVIAMSMFNSSIQLSVPRWVIGRVIALYQTCVFGGMAIGSWMWGGIALNASTSAALLGAAGVLGLGAIIGLRLPLPAFGTVNLEPLNRFREPELKFDVTYRSGPVMVMIDYIIDPVDADTFLALMARRRRIRIRDGAQQWVLLRDLEHPEQWSEAYHVPTWGEYVRHNQRRTQADAEVSDLILALHRGSGRPVVHRMIERQSVPPRESLAVRS